MSYTKRALNWREAAEDALCDLELKSANLVAEGREVDDYPSWIDSLIDSFYEAELDDYPASALAACEDAGALAFHWLYTNHFPQNPDELFCTIIELLVDRQKKYGHGNIMKHTELGVAVRMSDKAARLLNSTADFADESYVDAFMDIVGYACIVMMLSEGTFTLPLEED